MEHYNAYTKYIKIIKENLKGEEIVVWRALEPKIEIGDLDPDDDLSILEPESPTSFDTSPGYLFKNSPYKRGNKKI